AGGLDPTGDELSLDPAVGLRPARAGGALVAHDELQDAGCGRTREGDVGVLVVQPGDLLGGVRYLRGPFLDADQAGVQGHAAAVPAHRQHVVVALPAGADL